jgi:hypothetical protein
LPDAIVLAHDRGMSRPSGTRLVYSSQSGRICPGCGWPERECKCSTTLANEKVPADLRERVREVLAKKGYAVKGSLGQGAV